MNELPDTLRGRYEDVLHRIGRAATAAGRKRPRRGAGDAHMCCCTAHDDHTPSLSTNINGDRILLHCHAGCPPEDVAASIGYPMEALFEDYRGEATTGPKIHWNGSSRVAEAAVRGEAPEADIVGGFDINAGQRVPLPPTLTEFQALDYPPIEPILGPFATQQLCLLYAPTGAGKTMFGASVGYAMAEGNGFIGWESAGAVKVLYVDAEMAARMMQERFTGSSSENLFIANLPGWWADVEGAPVNLTTESAQKLLDFWISATGAQVIVLDNFMSLAWKDGTSFSSDEIWTPLRRWMLAQRAAGRTVILIDHANDSNRVFGTKTKTHIMDLIAVLEPVEDDGAEAPESDDPFTLNAVIQGARIVLKWTKKRGFSDSAPEVIHKEMKIGRVGIDWEWSLPVDPFVREIAELRQNGLSLREIAKDLKVSFSKVQRAWKQAQKVIQA